MKKNIKLLEILQYIHTQVLQPKIHQRVAYLGADMLQ